MPNPKLNNNVEIPALGFGTFANVLVKGETCAAVLAVLDAGYRHLDCAWYYLNEEEIDAALKQWFSMNSSVKREDLFITMKLWPHLAEPEDVEWSLNNSLKTLGKTTSIGVSNWKISDLEAMLKYAEIEPMMNQVEIHPFLPNIELGQIETTQETPLQNAELAALAEKKGVLAVPPKSANEARIRSNFVVVDLSEEELGTICKAAEGRHYRFVNPKVTSGYDVWPEESS
ncbi:Aldo/keto reductase [Hyaloscypha bicolor E]|uniref:Aldo/keto reductase n=1 Tax=Hyaloscypha bicolor E TaxID=1095630 RepID=A0A2J6T7Y2_9HELO|nr:Aldo/keto reductase [Hyaloscypha bicolor E]PMD59135.1 Aldo/keto reductase [Hyaloscypha bicolor E]